MILNLWVLHAMTLLHYKACDSQITTQLQTILYVMPFCVILLLYYYAALFTQQSPLSTTYKLSLPMGLKTKCHWPCLCDSVKQNGDAMFIMDFWYQTCSSFLSCKTKRVEGRGAGGQGYYMYITFEREWNDHNTLRFYYNNDTRPCIAFRCLYFDACCNATWC